MPTSTREKPPRFPFRAVGVDAYLGAKSRALRGCASKLACGRRIDPSHRPNGNAPARGGRTLLHWVSILHRRGGRPCPPAGNARFYGDLLRNRNILKGRCGHRPLQTATKNSTNFEGGQRRPPLQPVLENRVWVEKSPRFPFRAYKWVRQTRQWPPRRQNMRRPSGRRVFFTCS